MTRPAFSFNGPLVVRSPNWLGDAVMALAAVRDVKLALGPQPLAVAAPEKLAALWEACPFVDRVLPLPEPRNLTAVATRLREGKFETAILLPNSMRAAAEAWVARIPRRAAYARDGRSLLLTDPIVVPPRNPARLHQRFYYLDLVAALGAPGEDNVPALRLPESKPADASMKPVLALCPGAEYGPAKRWPVENFAAVARHFAEKRGWRTVLFGAPSDVPVAEELLKLLPEAENRAGQTTLSEFIAALAGAKFVLCNDSGAMHLAAALGVSTVAIFGSTEPLMTGPVGPRASTVRHHVPCSPCFLRECPIDFACMTSITPERVIAEAEKLLK